MLSCSSRAVRARLWKLRKSFRSLDLGFAELDVLAGDRVVFLLDQLVGLRARVLLGHVIESRVGARHQLDLDGAGLGHGKTSHAMAPAPLRRRALTGT